MTPITPLKSLRLSLAALCLAVLHLSAARACQICIPYPQVTAADIILSSDAVAIAREDPENPDRLAIVEVLKGSVEKTATGVELPAPARQRLMFFPEDGVILARKGARSDWQRVEYAEPTYRTFVFEILSHADDWRETRGRRARIAFFAERLNNENISISKQAFLEIGRAPYVWTAIAARKVPVERIRAVLADPQLVEWHRLFILLLGYSKAAQDRETIEREFEAAARLRTTANLSAWATAYLENHPQVGLATIETLYFANPERSRTELEEILRAVSTLANAGGPFFLGRTAQLRRRLAAAYAPLLDRHPEMAGWVANDLLAWRRKALVGKLTAIRKSAKLDPAATFSVDAYLGAAAEFPDFPADG